MPSAVIKVDEGPLGACGLGAGSSGSDPSQRQHARLQTSGLVAGLMTHLRLPLPSEAISRIGKPFRHNVPSVP